jgi:hypothetical protein
MLAPPDLIVRFLNDAKTYLAHNGAIVMPFLHVAGSGNNPQLRAPECGYQAEEVFSIDVPQESELLQKGRFSIYLLK